MTECRVSVTELVVVLLLLVLVFAYKIGTTNFISVPANWFEELFHIKIAKIIGQTNYIKH